MESPATMRDQGTYTTHRFDEHSGVISLPVMRTRTALMRGLRLTQRRASRRRASGGIIVSFVVYGVRTP